MRVCEECEKKSAGEMRMCVGSMTANQWLVPLRSAQIHLLKSEE